MTSSPVFVPFAVLRAQISFPIYLAPVTLNSDIAGLFLTLSSSGLGHRPFTAVTRVRIPLGSIRLGFRLAHHCADAQRFMMFMPVGEQRHELNRPERA
jgi:hypothetical protein